MNRRRAVLSVLVAFSMGHLSLVNVDFACARHASAAPAEDVMAGMEHHGAPSERDHGKPCRTPARADCCQAAASCDASVPMAGALLTLAPNVVMSPAARALAAEPLARATAP